MAHKNAIKQWLKGKCPAPIRIQYHITNRCNLRCIFCWQYSTSKKLKELSDKKWLELSKEACEIDVKRITISGGGEPFMRPKTLCGIMDTVKGNGLRMEIITNGTLITSKLAEKIVKSGLDSIAFSVHSSDSKIDELIRVGKNSLKKTIQGINFINHWKKKLRRRRPRLGIFMVITKYNYNGVYEMINLAETLGVSKLDLKMVNEPIRNPEDSIFMKKEHLEEFLPDLKKAKKFGKSHGIEFNEKFIINDIINHLDMASYKNERDERSSETVETIYTPCQFPFYEMVIFANGKTSQCCNFFDVDSGVVDDITHKNLREVWWGGPFEKLRRMVVEEKLPDTCTTCSIDFMSENKSAFK